MATVQHCFVLRCSPYHTVSHTCNLPPQAGREGGHRGRGGGGGRGGARAGGGDRRAEGGAARGGRSGGGGDALPRAGRALGQVPAIQRVAAHVRDLELRVRVPVPAVAVQPQVQLRQAGACAWLARLTLHVPRSVNLFVHVTLTLGLQITVHPTCLCGLEDHGKSTGRAVWCR